MIHLWEQLRHYGNSHGVDPLIFAALYFARLPLLVTALATLLRRVRRRQPTATVAVVFLALGVFPYTYILAFGRGLPAWFTAVVSGIAALTVAQGARKVRALLARDSRPVADAVVPGEAAYSDGRPA